jgi:hypothetical protein
MHVTDDFIAHDLAPLNTLCGCGQQTILDAAVMVSLAAMIRRP